MATTALLSIVTFVKALQLLKANFPNFVTLLGIVTEVRPEETNAFSSIVVTLLGMVMKVRLLQPLKALLPIVVKLLGRVTEVSFLHS